jgi:hypothetical protein
MYYRGGTFSKNSCFERRSKTLPMHFLFLINIILFFKFQ